MRKNRTFLGIYRARHHSLRERWVCIVVEAAGVLDFLVTLLSLGSLTSDYRSDLLFSDWADCD